MKNIGVFFIKNFILFYFLFSCSQRPLQSQVNLGSTIIGSEPSNTDAGTPAAPIKPPAPPVAPTPNPAPVTSLKFEPLAWEAKVTGSSYWSNTIYNVIQSEEPQMLGQNVADDIELFCPAYRTLTDHQRLNFWGQLFAGMSKFESGWNPATYYVETTMGLDPVTGRQVASEGLLQLSYQDQRSYNLDCGFDWAVDKNYTNTDSRKSIFDPLKNLRCGIKILAKQLARQRAISTTTDVYWSVLKKNGRYTKVPEIAAITKTLRFCN